MALTDRQERFCQEYIIDANATQAAIRAGYCEKTARSTGSRLLTKADIRARIDELMAEIKSQKIADATEVQEYLTGCIRGTADEEVVVVEGVGDGCSEAKTMVKKMAGRERVKAAELLGKMHGMFTERVAVMEEQQVIVLGKSEEAEHG